MNRKRKACVVVVLLAKYQKELNEKKAPKKPKRWWTKEWLQHEERMKWSHINLLDFIKMHNEVDYRNYFRMSDTCFQDLLQMVTQHIKKEDTKLRQSISAKKRLAVTLRFLATGQSGLRIQRT